MNWYLKYRPRDINQLGLNNVRQTLTKLLSGKTIPHAFLLAGPRGLGKTSTARIIGQYVNCLKPKSIGVPCGQCSACRLIQEKTTMDIIEMDAASNRGVDDIRQLKSEVGLAPSQLKYKVYIIDEVHMLTTEAFNALLKTLEEPPRHVIFILATTEPQKIPETIKSRCQIIEYHLASIDEINQTLKRVADAEKIDIDSDTISLIAKKARGSFRDGIKLLERLSQNGNINQDLLTNLSRIESVIDDLFQSLLDQDFGFSLELIDKIQTMSYPALEVIYELELKLNQQLNNIQNLGPNQLSYYQDLIRGLLASGANFGEPISGWLSLKSTLISLKLKYNQGASRNLQPASIKKSEIKKEKPAPFNKKAPEPKINQSKSAGRPKASFNLENIKTIWPQIIQTSVELNHGLKNILAVCRLDSINGRVINLSVGYPLQKDLLNKANVRKWLEAELAKRLKIDKAGYLVNVDAKLKNITKVKRGTAKSTAKPDPRLDILME